jgi:hypothetical protein
MRKTRRKISSAEARPGEEEAAPRVPGRSRRSLLLPVEEQEAEGALEVPAAPLVLRERAVERPAVRWADHLRGRADLAGEAPPADWDAAPRSAAQLPRAEHRPQLDHPPAVPRPQKPAEAHKRRPAGAPVPRARKNRPKRSHPVVARRPGRCLQGRAVPAKQPDGRQPGANRAPAPRRGPNRVEAVPSVPAPKSGLGGRLSPPPVRCTPSAVTLIGSRAFSLV